MKHLDVLDDGESLVLSLIEIPAPLIGFDQLHFQLGFYYFEANSSNQQTFDFRVLYFLVSEP